MIFAAQFLSAHVRTRFDLRIPMRDGVELSADAWMPLEEGRYPTILIRTPYIKADPMFRFPEVAKLFASHGYAILIQDTRGRGDSDGEFDFFHQEGKDGYDTIEWIARQSWSNGKVGMMGVSYLGAVQWLVAFEKPPHLVCIVPTAAPANYFEEAPYHGGAFQMQFALSWLNGTSGRISQTNSSGLDWERVFKHRPLLTMDEVMGRKMPLYRKWLKHSVLDSYWKQIIFSPDDLPAIDIPALHVTGWFDGDQIGALIYWRGMMKNSPAKDNQYLLIGPWTHVETFMGGDDKQGEMELTKDSIVENMKLHLEFFGHYLKEESPEFDFPRAKIYVTGSNEWRELTEYPPASVKEKRLYFHSRGKANTLLGDGTLSWDLPKNESPDKYAYDPKDPVPDNVDGEIYAVDNRLIEIRKDILVYTSETLKEPIEIIGQTYVELFAASDARDTDFMAKIIDVFPDGRAVNLSPKGRGVIRARYRNGYEREELLTPNKPERFPIKLFDIGHTFLPGHKIRIEILSSAYPAIAPNQNTGNPVATDTEWKIAQQTIYHDSKRPSAVVLPLMPKK